jgi:hypothetical protein
MSYVATIPVIFPCSRWRVYEALCDLESYPLWNSGMTHISFTGAMREGLRYETRSLLVGHANLSKVEVTRLVPGEEVELMSESGLIAFRVVFILREVAEETTEVICTLRFEFQNFVLDLARPVIESMAQVRVRGDLETLRILLLRGKK